MRLAPATLASLPAAVARPRYDRSALKPGIVHLGIGAFMRAHLAVATEAALHADGDMRWGIVGVSLRQTDTRDALAPQGGLYSVAVRDADEGGAARQRLQVVGCIVQLLVAPENPTAVLDAIAASATRVVSLTVTEKGYAHDPATRALKFDHPDIAHDLAHANAPRSAVGLIVHGLARRRAAGLGPLTLMSLDNLPSNGHTLRGLVLSFAKRVDLQLADWIDAQCTFPNSMVDRIVPRTTNINRNDVQSMLGATDAWPVMAEPFFDWAVEDQFAAGRPAWQGGGARLVHDAAPYETLKLRMVNGSHSAMAYLGAMAGWGTVDEAIGQPPLRHFIEALMREEIEPTLQPMQGLDLAAYRTQLITRFANPALAHRTQQIAMDGSQKLPQRLLGTVRDRLAAGLSVARLGVGIAAWLHYLRGRDELDEAYAIDDPLANELTTLVRHGDAAPQPRERAAILTSHPAVFGDLVGAPALLDAVSPALEMLRQQGVRATVAALG